MTDTGALAVAVGGGYPLIELWALGRGSRFSSTNSLEGADG